MARDDALTATRDAEDVLATAARWRDQGRKVAVATVVSTWGSAPRRPGSQLAVDEDGNFVGSVSGGCVEGSVITEAFKVMKDGKGRLLDFGVSDEQAWHVGLACGGKLEVFLEPVE